MCGENSEPCAFYARSECGTGCGRWQTRFEGAILRARRRRNAIVGHWFLRLCSRRDGDGPSRFSGESARSGRNTNRPLARQQYFLARPGAVVVPGRVLSKLSGSMHPSLLRDEATRDRMMSSKRQFVKPSALRPGDTVGIVAPASNIKRADLEAGCEALRRAGYRPFYFESILDQDLYFAGSAERRARELEEMFVRDDVRAIVCARGGYGSNYLLDLLDLNKIKAHPKIFVGYSDLTTLLTYFADSIGLVTFQGPMVAQDFAHVDGIDLASWEQALSGTSEWTLPC